MNEEKKIRFPMKVKLEGLEMTPKSIDKTGAYKNQRLIATVGEAPSYNEFELKAAIAKGTAAWADVPDAVAWVRELRGETRE